MMRILLLALLALLSQGTHAEVPSPSPRVAHAKAALEKYAPTSRAVSEAYGDLNGDGIEDLAMIIEAPKQKDRVAELRMVVFLGAKDQTFSFHESSLDIFKHDRVYTEVSISGQSLFLHRDGSGGCCERWAENFQFQFRRGIWMLIGIETAVGHPANDDGTAEDDFGVSVNLITGYVIKWVDHGQQRKQKKRKVKSAKPVPFKEFSYDRYADMQSSW